MAVDTLIERHAIPYLLDSVLTQSDLQAALASLSREWSTLPEGAPTNGIPGTGLDHGHYGGYVISSLMANYGRICRC